jgi:phosphate transport system permease protein
VFLIIAFIFAKGGPMMVEYGVLDFIFGMVWRPEDGRFGVFPMIIGTLYVIGGALAIAAPLGLACAIFLAEIAPPKIRDIMKPSIEALAGIPSVIYGFFGLVVVIPFMRDVFGAGPSIATGSIILAIMILPTLISVAQDAIRAVPKEFKEGSLALGATHWQSIRRVILPAAAPGVMCGMILGLGRAVGEALAVMMVTGNVVAMPDSIFDPMRALSANVALEMPYAPGTHREALFATGVILLGVIILMTLLMNYIQRWSRSRWLG